MPGHLAGISVRGCMGRDSVALSSTVLPPDANVLTVLSEFLFLMIQFLLLMYSEEGLFPDDLSIFLSTTW